MADPYMPNGPADTNPIGCVASWFVDLIRPRSPAYARAEPTATPADPKEITVARVRGVVVERMPVYQADGSTVDDGTGPVLGITLVIDDDDAALTVLEAIHHGTPIRVLSGGAAK